MTDPFASTEAAVARLRRQLGEGDDSPEPDAVALGMMQPGLLLEPLAAAIRQRPAWMSRGACRGTATSAFFGADNARIPDVVAERCAGCTVRAECLEWAIEHDEAGTWAGTTQRERRRMRRQRAA